MQNNGGDAAAGGFMAAFGAIYCVGMLIGALGLAFAIWMLIDAIKRCPSEDNKKLIWILVIIFGNWCLPIGAIAYYFVQRPKNAAATPPSSSPPA